MCRYTWVSGLGLGNVNGLPAFVANYDYHQRAMYTGPAQPDV